ncbi:hypothetical protein CDAR_73621 [Caerostris darwini]|uniref:ATP synthase F0 subunit 8 n=1 Tax=Caerostris darwini TaxID=1538125 RepID=A0AAV4MSD3_9ARAC|nr:hypothetical protein CDAR_73621 [Caerostris darwini]
MTFYVPFFVKEDDHQSVSVDWFCSLLALIAYLWLRFTGILEGTSCFTYECEQGLCVKQGTNGSEKLRSSGRFKKVIAQRLGGLA